MSFASFVFGDIPAVLWEWRLPPSTSKSPSPFDISEDLGDVALVDMDTVVDGGCIIVPCQPLRLACISKDFCPKHPHAAKKRA